MSAPVKLFDKILIANRGEIACRIARTARRLGIKTVAVYSSADATSQHVREADEAIFIGNAPTSESYLRGDRLVDAAMETGAQAIHPGYGFLSESAEFAASLEAKGLTFVGPSSTAIRAMGSKANAKAVMQAAGVPVTPGYWGEDGSLARFQAEAEAIGYPVMLKAVRGGGGKGMRVVLTPGDLPGAYEACKREATTSFGSSDVLVERYLPRPRHIEFQVMGDSQGTVIHLAERDCSVQRRHQKVLEEAPAPGLPPAIRQAMGAAAVAAAKAVGYVGAGTVEFMLDSDALRAGGGKRAENPFFFMEMNCRLQVEHPVTEMILGGLDLVELQLRVAAGHPLGLTQADIAARLSGHAIEARVCAEVPERGFLPATGTLRHFSPTPVGIPYLKGGTPEAHHFPTTTTTTTTAAGSSGASTPTSRAPKLRVDSAVVSGDSVSMYYDSMVAKVIAWGEDREAAREALSRALGGVQMAGLPSNLGFLRAVVGHPGFVAGAVDTSFLPNHIHECLPPAAAATGTAVAGAAAAVGLSEAPPPVWLAASVGAALRVLGGVASPSTSASATAAQRGGGGGGGGWKSPWSPGAISRLEPMQPATQGMSLVFGVGGEGGNPTTHVPVRVTPLGSVAVSTSGGVSGTGTLVPGFIVDLGGNSSSSSGSGSGEGGRWVCAGVVTGEGGEEELTMHFARLPASASISSESHKQHHLVTSATAPLLLLEEGARVHKSRVVFTSAPVRVIGLVQAGGGGGGGGWDVHVFPRDPGFKVSTSSSPSSSSPATTSTTREAELPPTGTFKFTLPQLAVGGAGKGGAGGEGGASGAKTVAAPMPGKVVKILVKEGDTVASGQALFILEAMKMEHSVKATFTGTVTKVHSRVGDLVEDGRVLITCEGK